MVQFEVTDVIRTVKYCNFSSYTMKLQYLKYILTKFFFQKSKLKKPSFHMRFTNPAHSVHCLARCMNLNIIKKTLHKELTISLFLFQNQAFPIVIDQDYVKLNFLTCLVFDEVKGFQVCNMCYFESIYVTLGQGPSLYYVSTFLDFF